MRENRHQQRVDINYLLSLIRIALLSSQTIYIIYKMPIQNNSQLIQIRQINERELI